MRKLLLTGATTCGMAAILLSGCYYDSYEELYVPPGGVICNTDSVSYAQTIQPILNQHCALSDCHLTGSNPGGYIFDNYNDTKAGVGRIMGAIEHAPGYSPMPKNMAKLPDCERRQIEAWINQGALDN